MRWYFSVESSYPGKSALQKKIVQAKDTCLRLGPRQVDAETGSGQ